MSTPSSEEKVLDHAISCVGAMFWNLHYNNVQPAPEVRQQLFELARALQRLGLMSTSTSPSNPLRDVTTKAAVHEEEGAVEEPISEVLSPSPDATSAAAPPQASFQASSTEVGDLSTIVESESASHWGVKGWIPASRGAGISAVVHSSAERATAPPEESTLVDATVTRAVPFQAATLGYFREYEDALVYNRNCLDLNQVYILGLEFVDWEYFPPCIQPNPDSCRVALSRVLLHGLRLQLRDEKAFRVSDGDTLDLVWSTGLREINSHDLLFARITDTKVESEDRHRQYRLRIGELEKILNDLSDENVRVLETQMQRPAKSLLDRLGEQTPPTKFVDLTGKLDAEEFESLERMGEVSPNKIVPATNPDGSSDIVWIAPVFTSENPHYPSRFVGIRTSEEHATASINFILVGSLVLNFVAPFWHDLVDEGVIQPHPWTFESPEERRGDVGGGGEGAAGADYDTRVREEEDESESWMGTKEKPRDEDGDVEESGDGDGDGDELPKRRD